VFSKIDAGKRGCVTFGDVRKFYNANKHPKVKAGLIFSNRLSALNHDHVVTFIIFKTSRLMAYNYLSLLVLTAGLKRAVVRWSRQRWWILIHYLYCMNCNITLQVRGGDQCLLGDSITEVK